mmetsp:Transcript_13302/g.33833  ORF Transcript_13302/g.33833 Transcript_13302/m.33833 type:complete len:359 (+) Transcript_13302:141-1217(+)
MEELDEVISTCCPRADRGQMRCYILSGVTLAVVSIALLSSSFDTIPPTNYGLLQNKLTGYVDTQHVYSPGRYFVFLGHKFIHFPRMRQTIQFGGPHLLTASGRTVAPSIKARTGPDPSDVSGESGGQPLDLSASFQYRFDQSQIPFVYQMFGPLYEPSFVRFSRQAISNLAQQFTPADYWENRAGIELRMKTAVATALLQQGHAMVEDLQLTRVEFSDKYEEIILRVQLQEQLVTTKRYNLTVTQVQKEIDILASETDARVMRVNAEAAAQSQVIVNAARNGALELEQASKAQAYRRLKSGLGWSSQQFIHYLKVRSINAAQAAPGASDKVIVGIDALGGFSSSSSHRTLSEIAEQAL